MLEQDNLTRNIRADEWRVDFYRQNPTLRRVFSSREYKTLWSFLKPKRFLLFILIGISFALAFVEGGKALLLVGIIKGLVVSETGIHELLTFHFMDKTFSLNWFGLSDSRIGLIATLFIGLLFLTILAASGKLANTWFTKRVQLDLMRDVRRNVLEKIFSFDLKYFDQARSGELIFLMTAETSRFSNLVMFANNFLTNFIQVVIFMAILFYMSWDITLLVVLVAATYFKLHIPLDMRAKQKSWEANLTQNRLSHLFHQIIYGIKMIKIGGCENREQSQYFQGHKQFEMQELSLAKLSGLSAMFREFVIMAVLFLTVMYVYFFKDLKSLLVKPDQILAYLFLLSRAMPSIAALQTARTSMIGAYGPLARVMELLHKDIEAVQPVSYDKTTRKEIDDIHNLAVHDVRFSYDSNGNVLEDINLNFQRNKMYAIVGLSGSGKSTLMDILASVRRPVSGDVLVNGLLLDMATIQSFKQSVGYMNQEPIIFHDTIRTNVKYFKPDATEKEIWEALKLAAVDDFIKELPDGLDTGLGERGLTVSGGQRQRIGLARVFLQKAQILLLDEATNALDYETEKQIYNNLDKMKQDKIIIVAAHRLSAIKDFDHIVVLNHGKAEEQGTHSQLIMNKNLYYNLFSVQKYSGDIKET